MSEPIKKTEQQPESYSPKKKPEILNLMEESAGKIKMKQTYERKTANGGSYIDGIPLLRWGEWRDSSYCGCETALLNAAGFDVSYEEVMGLSGVCWQTIMRADWDPSSQMPQNGRLCEQNVGNALGIAVYTLRDEKKIRKQAKKSLDAGIPVLLVEGRWAPEWNIACGYALENGAEKFFGRTYFDCQHTENPQNTIEHQAAQVAADEIHTENGYVLLNKFPGCAPQALTRFYDKSCKPIPRKDALRVSLETCLAMFELPRGEHHAFGGDAYDILIEGLSQEDEAYRAQCGNDQYHIGSLMDARRAAYVYLESSADLLQGNPKALLEQAAELYRTMFDKLADAIPYEKTSGVFNRTSAAVWDTAQREKLTNALKENKTREKEVRSIIAALLAEWRK